MASTKPSTAQASRDARMHARSSRDAAFPFAAFAVWRAAGAITLAAFGGATAARQITGLRPASHPAIYLWDGAWYQRVMLHGYTPFPGGGQQPSHFFPLLPWVTRAVTAVVRSEAAAALLVANASALAAVVLVHRVLERWKGARVARIAIVLLLAFPSSFFLWQFYTEGLFLALTAGALLAQQKDKMWLAGLLAAGATMTRPPGFLMVLVLAAGVLQRRRRLHPDLAWCALGLAGFIPIMAAQAIQAHDPVAFVSSQSGWGIAFATPWHTLTTSLHSYVHDGGPGVAGWAWSTVSNIGSPRDLVASYLLIALIIVAFYRAWPWTARTMMLAMVLLPLSGGVPLAMSRYVLAAWPGFGVGAELLDRAPRVVRWGIVLLLVAVSILVLHDFAAGLYEG